MAADDSPHDLDTLSAVLRATDRRLNAFLEHSGEMVALLAVDSTILYASPATKRWLGYSDEEFIGRKAYEFVHPDDVAGARAQLAALLGVSHPIVAEARFRHRDGSWRTLSGTFANRTRDPAVGAVVVNYRDVTTERAAEAAHEALRQHAAYALDAVGVGMWEVEVKSNTTTMSDSMAAIFGIRADEFDGAVETFQRLVHPDDRQTVAAAIERMLTSDAPYDIQFRVVRPDGSSRWIHAKARVVRDDAGLPDRVVGVSIDVTDQKRLESQLLQTQRLEALGQLSAGVVHDFNNIITVVLGTSELVEESFDSDDPRLGDIRTIREAAQSAKRLTTQLLAFSRQQPVAPTLVDLNEAVRTSERLVRLAVGSRISLQTHLSAETVPVRIDHAQFEQIMLNLAVNAADAIQASGTVTIRTTTATISAGGEADALGVTAGRYATLLFEDDGPGMPADVQARIFEPFFTTKAKGTGLGLATVYGIVRQSGGYISVSSDPGRGTRFAIGLPLSL